MDIIRGRVWRFEDNVDTDQIYPGRYLSGELSNEQIASHAMEGNKHPRFREEVQEGDIIIADENFGCGSSREHAAATLKYRGISVIIAPSYGRIFYRNCFSIAMPLLESDEVKEIREGDIIEVNLKQGTIVDETTGKTYAARPIPEVLYNIYSAGGIRAMLEKQFGSEGKSI